MGAEEKYRFNFQYKILIQQQDSIYDGCGTTKTCVGMPIGCELDESCRAIVTVAIVNDRYEFEMESGVGKVYFVIYLAKYFANSLFD